MKILNCGKSAGKIPLKYGYYICGFTDGEGSFNISFKLRSDYHLGVKISASFNISQKEKSILLFIKDVFQCGTIRSRKDGIYYFEVTNIKDLHRIIIPFFNKFKLQTKKKYSFKVFSEIVNMMISNQHRTKEGMLRIYKLREKVKVGRKRKFTYQEVRNAIKGKSSETIRQTSEMKMI